VEVETATMPLPKLSGPYSPLREFLFNHGYADRDPNGASHAEYLVWFENTDARVIVYVTKNGVLDVRGDPAAAKAWKKEILKAKVFP
jgi:hypothetical protein